LLAPARATGLLGPTSFSRVLPAENVQRSECVPKELSVDTARSSSFWAVYSAPQ
jgi:hypothetical protein